jgi:hypothetical protein
MNNKQMLLVENVSTLSVTIDAIEKSREKNNGQLILNGILQRASMKNANNRVYPIEYLRREVDRYQTKINENRAYGELDHPDDPSVQLKNVSHRILRTYWEGNIVYGDILVLGGYTPMGSILEGILKSGGNVGISSRAVGSTTRTNEGLDMVNSDMTLIGFDTVSDASTVGSAILNLKEGKEVDIKSNPYLRQLNIEKILDEMIMWNKKGEEFAKKQLSLNQIKEM